MEKNMIQKVKELCKKYGFKLVKDGVDYYICAKDTDRQWTRWVHYNPKADVVSYLGNTDHLNIWLYKTRPDLTPEILTQFVEDLNQTFELVRDDLFFLNELIDPEDWQEIADIPDAYSDKRYAKTLFEATQTWFQENPDGLTCEDCEFFEKCMEEARREEKIFFVSYPANGCKEFKKKKEDSSIRPISEEEFRSLKEGDEILVKCGGKIYPSKILGAPFYNVDADEPDWEVETSSGFADAESLYVKTCDASDEKSLENIANDLLSANEENLKQHSEGYGRGYAEGYHDALVDVLSKMGIETCEEYFN